MSPQRPESGLAVLGCAMFACIGSHLRGGLAEDLLVLVLEREVERLPCALRVRVWGLHTHTRTRTLAHTPTRPPSHSHTHTLT